MSRECELTGTKPMTGHNVSHSQMKTKRIFRPNLVQVTLHSDALSTSSASWMRSWRRQRKMPCLPRP